MFSDEKTIHPNCVTELLCNLPGRKKARTNCEVHLIKVNVCKGFGGIVSFKQNRNAEFMCDSCKRILLPTVAKQFDHHSTLWKLQEDNGRKHTGKPMVNWKRNHAVDEIDCPSMSTNFALMENIRLRI